MLMMDQMLLNIGPERGRPFDKLRVVLSNVEGRGAGRGRGGGPGAH
jgi:hypothetical protein